MWYTRRYDLVFLSLWFIGIALFRLRRRIWRKFSLGSPDKTADSPADSAILSYYTAGHGLINTKRAQLDGMAYALYATVPLASGTDSGIAFVEDDAAIYVLDLPFNTQSHFVGLSKSHKLNRLQFESFLKASGMEKVVLEGDFPDYFDIYAAKGQQFEVRTVLDPEAMAFVVDYCQSHFWEINDSEMYFAVTNADQSKTGDLSLIGQSQQFVTQIKPALMPGQPGAPVVHHEVPYGEYDGPALSCPICQQQMTINDAWQACPDGHGILINGRDLARLHTGELRIPDMPGKNTPHKELTCPNCHNQMVNTDYEGSAVKIDSCEHCPFRWLDAGEIPLLAPKSQ